MFEITTQQPVKLVNYNPRAEKHGKERKPAATMRVQVAMPAAVLNLFERGLYDALYEQVTEGDDLVSTSTRRFKKMAPFSWAFEGKGYTTTVDYGLGGESNIELDDCTVKDFRITPQENDIVLIDFAINCAPDERESGILYHRIPQEIQITVKAPAPQTVGELFGDEPQEQEPATAEED
ncbi:MAG: hypothetical protein INH13_32695 [Cupriavidus sp.]|nr:hypothetical protein [Cupriavidus sp.]